MLLDKKVLLLEDNTTSSVVQINMQENGYDVYGARNFVAAHEYISIEPGINAFHFLVVDLELPLPKRASKYFSPEELQKIRALKEETNCCLSGWIWIQRILREHPSFSGRVLVLSAYTDVLHESEQQAYKNSIGFISKTDPEVIDKLLAALGGKTS